MTSNEESSSLNAAGSPFEVIRRKNETGNDYWSARDLARVLGYEDYRIEDHFGDITEMVDIGSDAKREIDTVCLY